MQTACKHFIHWKSFFLFLWIIKYLNVKIFIRDFFVTLYINKKCSFNDLRYHSIFAIFKINVLFYGSSLTENSNRLHHPHAHHTWHIALTLQLNESNLLWRRMQIIAFIQSRRTWRVAAIFCGASTPPQTVILSQSDKKSRWHSPSICKWTRPWFCAKNFSLVQARSTTPSSGGLGR